MTYEIQLLVMTEKGLSLAVCTVWRWRAKISGLTAPEENRMANCPVCDAEIDIPADTVVGELMSCEDCGCELEVLNLDPAKLGEAPEAEEDWGE